MESMYRVIRVFFLKKLKKKEQHILELPDWVYSITLNYMYVVVTVSPEEHSRFFEKVLLRDKMLFVQQVIWNSAGLNSCVTKQGQNDLSFQCRILYTDLQTVLAKQWEKKTNIASRSWAAACVLSLRHTSYACIRYGLFPFHVAARKTS